MTTREEMKQNAQAHNRHLTDRYLFGMQDHQLLCFTHPLERELFARKLQEEAKEMA